MNTEIIAVRQSVKRDLADIERISLQADAVTSSELASRAVNGWKIETACLREYSNENRVSDAVIGYSISKPFYNEHTWKIHSIVVDEPYRRRGAGRAMLANIEGKLSADGCSKMRAAVWDHNLTGHLFLFGCEMKCLRVLKGVVTYTDEDGNERADDSYLFEKKFKIADYAPRPLNYRPENRISGLLP